MKSAELKETPSVKKIRYHEILEMNMTAMNSTCSISEDFRDLLMEYMSIAHTEIKKNGNEYNPVEIRETCIELEESRKKMVEALSQTIESMVDGDMLPIDDLCTMLKTVVNSVEMLRKRELEGYVI